MTISSVFVAAAGVVVLSAATELPSFIYWSVACAGQWTRAMKTNV